MTSFSAIATVTERTQLVHQMTFKTVTSCAYLSNMRGMCLMGNHRQPGSFAGGRSHLLSRGSCRLA